MASHENGPPRRVSIADVAARAGVSKGSASFALNGRPGVSEATRARVLAVAAELGWTPNAAARALADGRSGAVGLVLRRPPRFRGVQPVLQAFLEGVQDELVDHSMAMLMEVVVDHRAELDVYTEWARSGRVDGMVVLDQRTDDDRLPLLRKLDMPAVVLGDPRYASGVPAVWVDESVGARELVAHLAGLGHRRLARVATFPRLALSHCRTLAFEAACAEAGLPAPVVVHPGTEPQTLAAAMRELLARDEAPTALVCEHDLIAMAALGAAHGAGLAVPRDLSIVTWEQSAIAELSQPPLTTLVADPHGQAGVAARLLIGMLNGTAADSQQVEPARLVVRSSTAAAR